MKRILINATHAEEVRVALCNGNHLYDFDLENRTREQKKANIYKGHVTRVEPSLEAVFVEYGSARQGFLPIREIASDYLSGDPRSGNIKNLIKEGDELIVQIEKEERGNKGAALSTFVSLAGRYLVLMPNNPRGGGISRQISGKLRDEMKQILSDLRLPKGMSVIIRTAGIGKSSDELQQDLDHLLTIWKGIQEQNKKYPSPRLVHQEAGVVTRAVRDYLRDDIAEIWVDNENAYNEAANFIEAVMPQQASKLRKYTDFEPMFARFGIEKQIETAYQREVRLPSGGSIVIDQTEALVSIDINSSKATKGADVSETAYNTNLEAAEEIARQLRLRDMGGLIVIDFIDMATTEHQKQVENRLREATKNDRARIQFAEISRFGLLEMSRQRLRPSLEEATGFLCPRCHGNGMIRDLRSLALSIMRQIEQKALLERQGEVQAEVPTEIAAFLLNEKRESLVYLEQDSGTRITILPHAHLESPNFTLTYNREGFAPTSYERISESEQSEIKDRGYDTNWHTEQDVLETQPRYTSPNAHDPNAQRPSKNAWSNAQATNSFDNSPSKNPVRTQANQTAQPSPAQQVTQTASHTAPQMATVAWLSNLFAPAQQATLADKISSQAVASALEEIVNAGGKSLGVYGQLPPMTATAPTPTAQAPADDDRRHKRHSDNRSDTRSYKDKKERFEKEKVEKSAKIVDEPKVENKAEKFEQKSFDNTEQKTGLPKREPHSKRESRGEKERKPTLTPPTFINAEAPTTSVTIKAEPQTAEPIEKSSDPSNVQIHVIPVVTPPIKAETIQLSLDGSKTSIKNTIEDVTKNAVSASTNVPTATSVTVAAPSETPVVTKSVTTDVTDQVKKVEAVPQKLTDVVPTSAQPQTVVAAPEQVTSEPTPLPTSTLPQNNLKTEYQLPIPVADIQVTPELPVMPEQGRAKNDPREVYKLFMKNSFATKTPEAIVPTVVTQTAQRITGTVGQFIDQHLPNTVKDGVSVVSHFLEAMQVFGNNQNVSPTNELSAPKEKITAENGKFDEKFSQFFRNYGFTAVTQADIANYQALRQPQNRFVCEAGSNDSQPTKPTERASNDPRGNLTDAQLVTTVATPVSPKTAVETVEETKTEAKATEKSVKPKEPEASTEHTYSAYAVGSVGSWIVQKLGKTGESMIAEGNVVTAFLQACQTVDPLSHSDNSVVATDAHALVAELAVDKVVETADKILHTHPSSSEVAEENVFKENLSTKQDSDTQVQEEDSNQKTKTTATSYKNMIESVAEQMSMGGSTLLKLSTTKPVRKPRVKKEKTTDKVVIKAPAKAKSRTSKKVESAVVTKVVKKSTENTELSLNEDGSNQ